MLNIIHVKMGVRVYGSFMGQYSDSILMEVVA